MKPYLYPTFLGRSWTVRNESSRPDDEVLALLGFVLERTGGLSAKGAILVKDSLTHGDDTGVAGDRRQGHGFPRWVNARTRFYMRLTLPLDDWYLFGRPNICWHSTGVKKLAGEIGTAAFYDHLADLVASGQDRFGRWPIYRLEDWRECLVHLAAHEAAHLIQYDRDRGAGGSEIFCETFALETLEAFRRCGDEPNDGRPPTVPGNPGLAALGSLGLVTGPAPADSNNRKEPTVATTPQKADPKDLFASLLDQATKVADTTAKVEKAAYVRVDVLLDEGKRHKTLAYVNNPSSKAVRVEIPKKNGGGYDIIRVEKQADIDKALKAIRANHERIVASQTVAA